VATGSHTLARLSVGTSGWSYPSLRPGFYPAGLDPSEFLRFYAERFRTVELNTTGYRLPAEDQFRRWAEQVPDGFEFAPKLPGGRPVFPGIPPHSPEGLLERHGLKPGTTQVLDEAAGLSLVSWRR